APARRALRLRDRGCRWPGCDRQVNWSTPHHIVAWSKNGPTNLTNLVLLCVSLTIASSMKADGRWSKWVASSASFRPSGW
ncbi:HNH endonuclease, partial [bacterium]